MTDCTTNEFYDFAKGELLLIDKPYNWTSFDVVAKIRNSMKPGKIKVGHAGTLDPMATGLLIICTGKLTKKINVYQAQEKEYTGSMVLGATRPSFDMETEIDDHYDICHINPNLINETAKKFVGEIEQMTPPYSAIKINGERAYEKARIGDYSKTKTRVVDIKLFEITKIDMPNLYFRVICSKGAYIRSLVNDFGKSLNSGAYLSSLKRIRIGDFYVKNALCVDNLINIIKAKGN